MKNGIHLAIASIVCATILLVPHHRRASDTFIPNTLAGIYAKLFSEMPDRWTAERVTFLTILVVGVFATIAPVVCAGLLRWHRPPDGSAGGWTFGVAALVTGVGAFANAFLILLSNTSFAFGGRPVPGDVVAFAWGVAVIQLLFGVASLAIAVSARCAALAL